MKKKLLFRVDGGNVWGISIGHIKRAHYLATQLKGIYDIVFLMQNYSDGVTYVKKLGWDVHTIPVGDNSEQSIINFCKKTNPGIIIFDLVKFDYPIFTHYAKSQEICVIVFDIKGNIRGEPSIIINESFVPDLMHYDDVPAETRLYIGPDYFILPPEYLDITKPVLNHDVKNVVITMGGSDPAGLTVKILDVLRNNPYNLHYHVILGPAFKETEAVTILTKHLSNATIYKDPPNFIEILTWADIAMTSGGRTLMECSYLGIPPIVVPSIEHEELTAIEYSHLTGAINIGIWKSPESHIKLKSALTQYINNYSQRENISDSAKNMIDGKGIFRILDIINFYQTGEEIKNAKLDVSR